MTKSIQKEIEQQRLINMLLAIDELRHLFEVLKGLDGEAYDVTQKRIDTILSRLGDLAAKINS